MLSCAHTATGAESAVQAWRGILAQDHPAPHPRLSPTHCELLASWSTGRCSSSAKAQGQWASDF